MPAHDIASEHPGHDLLADLAAQDVLAPELAARVEAHVQGCERCAGLLAEAEALQSQLAHLAPEPMPADVALRLDQALAEAVRNPGSGPAPATATPATPIPPVVRAGATGELPTRRSLRQAAAQTGDLDTRALPTTGPIGGAAGQDAPPPATGAGRTITPSGGSPVTPGTPSGGVNTGPPTDMTRRIQIAGRGTGGPATGSTGRIDRPLGRLGRPGREPAGSSGARRQALEEQRSDEILDRRSRLAPMLRVAAGVVLVLIIGAGAVKVLTGGGDDTTTASESAAGSGGSAGLPVLAPVLATGTNYARDDLSTQIPALVTQSQATAPLSASGTDDSATGSATRTQSSATAAAAAQNDQNAASSDLLRSASALRACLTGIGEPNVQPLAVDLARYGGRDAAILVLPSTDGGYNVWVVRRDCAPDNQDSVLDQIEVPAS